MRLRTKRAENGFTLMEAVIVIVITGIIAAVTAVFITKPVQAYFDTIRRAELTDIADSAVRRMARDVQAALPNSIRITGGFLEYVPIRTAGRYRAAVGNNPADDPLNFTNPADNSFDVLGPPINIANGDSIVIYNLGQVGSDVYAGTSRRAAAAPFGAINNIAFTPIVATPFPFESPGSRFHVVSTAVSYVCQPDVATPANGFVYRYAGYAIQANQPTTLAALDALATRRIVATNVAACTMSFDPGTQQSLGLLSIFLRVANNGPALETVEILHQINVNNTP